MLGHLVLVHVCRSAMNSDCPALSCPDLYHYISTIISHPVVSWALPRQLIGRLTPKVSEVPMLNGPDRCRQRWRFYMVAPPLSGARGLGIWTGSLSKSCCQTSCLSERTYQQGPKPKCTHIDSPQDNRQLPIQPPRTD